MRLRTASAACRSGKPSRNCRMLTSARRQGCSRGLAAGGKEISKEGILKECAQFISQTHIQITCWERGLGDAGGFLGNRVNRGGFQGHRGIFLSSSSPWHLRYPLMIAVLALSLLGI